MNTHLTEAGELTRRLDLDQRARRAHRARPAPSVPRRRHQLAHQLRRFADRLEQ